MHHSTLRRRTVRRPAVAALAVLFGAAAAAPPAAHDVRRVSEAHALGRGGAVAARGRVSMRVPTRVPTGASASRTRQGDSAEVARTVTRFHEAPARGDSAGALALLAPEAVILESGGAETRDEYRGHHLPADIAFARAVRSVRSPIAVSVRGGAAWARSTSVTRGEYRGRAVNAAGAELMVLTRAPDAGSAAPGAPGWRIVAIHWSSRTRRR